MTRPVPSAPRRKSIVLDRPLDRRRGLRRSGMGGRRARTRQPASADSRPKGDDDVVAVDFGGVRDQLNRH